MYVPAFIQHAFPFEHSIEHFTDITSLIQGSRLILNLRAVAREQVWTANTVFELNVGRTEFRSLHDQEMASLDIARRNSDTESLSCESESTDITDV